jgi:Cu+-exporting ATPase
MRLALRIDGMHCIACAQNLKSALRALDGVQDVTVAYQSNTASFDLTKPKTWHEITRVAEDLRFQIVGKTLILSILGMKGKESAKQIEQALDSLPGIVTASVDLTSVTVSIRYISEMIDVEEILRKFSEMGFTATPYVAQTESQFM